MTFKLHAEPIQIMFESQVQDLRKNISSATGALANRGVARAENKQLNLKQQLCNFSMGENIAKVLG